MGDRVIDVGSEWRTFSNDKVCFAHLLTTLMNINFISFFNPPTPRHQNDLKVLLKDFVVTHNPQLILTNLLSSC